MDTDLTGKLLIALPGIGDPRFGRSVILICAHSPEFAMGIVLNKPVPDLTLPELLEQLNVPASIDVPDTFVLSGGPVAQDRGFVLHTDDVYSEGATLEIDDDLCMTATRDILHAIASSDAPRRSVMALGYSGWGAGQLEEELAENAWIVSDADPDIIFGGSHERKWRHALARMGIDSGRLQVDPGSC
ncbi:MAG TPA: YqgE/AlgH family protein [Hyphomonas sp.]|nr:YqgE/AlgH family protein [Hyphomonas sp.]MCA8905680.1 YqgE/AlgH family protein [Hyphomonas sp.]MCB9960725.1 YqgE/AlgH family protein [Hyphomonas sp.]MCB9971926.1 YqgE/AlgH family protein [Hyphomonas sp.]HPE48324.1 YqgE/AlgH family protein [Hyphomonas sp.]